ncbi:MAG: GNAT family N-acetyltransferase [Actinomycetes bacterium]
MTVEVTWSEAPRADLRWLFELAEDSTEQLNAYIDLGRVLVAREGSTVVGHLQLISVEDPLVLEIKSMAVAEERQGQGIGRTLVDAAVAIARSEGAATVLVSTATADVGTLRFYQRVGFRFLSVDRDAFTSATGYPDQIIIDGIELRDRVWLSMALTESGV